MALVPSDSAIFAEVEMGAEAASSSSSAPTVRATVVQASTIFYDTPATLDKAERLIAEAASYGAQLVVFPEAFIGGYPRGSDFGVTIGNRTPKGRQEFRKYHASAIDVPGPEVDRLAAMAGKCKVHLVMGVIERDGYTLYCTVLFFDSQGHYLGKHRKIMPTALERIIWGFGDGSTIPVFETPIGKIGAAICWENRMPLLRMAMYAKGVEIYCAPTADSREVWQASMTHIALEGGCFVLSANQFCRRKDYPPPPEYVFSGMEEDLNPESVVCSGGSVIISPSGTVLAGPNYDGEALISADLGRLQMIKGVLFGIQTYWSQIFIIPKKIMKEIESKFRCFLWTGKADNSRKSSVAWRQVCLPKVSGGWNVLSLTDWNKAAITRVLWDITHKADNLWVKWLHIYYFKHNNWWEKQAPGRCSWVLKKILKCRDLVDQLGGWDAIQDKGKMSIKKLYTQIRPQEPKVPWKRVICNNKATPKSIFILWLAIQNRLATKDRILKWQMTINPCCVLCEKENENLQHLFFNCEYSTRVWQQMMGILNLTAPSTDFGQLVQWITKASRISKDKQIVLTMVFAETVYAIWIERNAKIFEGQCKPPIILPREITYRVACKCNETCRRLLVI